MQKIFSVIVSVVTSIESFSYSVVRRTYPLISLDENGQTLFLEKSFDRTLQKAKLVKSSSPYVKPLLYITLWKNILELLASVFFWVISSSVERFIGMPYALVLPTIVILYFLYQELFVDAELGKKHWQSTIVDALIWTLPSVWFILSLLF